MVQSRKNVRVLTWHLRIICPHINHLSCVRKYSILEINILIYNIYIWYSINTKWSLMSILDEALDELNALLRKKNHRIEILICGAYALEMYGLSPERNTLDVDSAKEIPSDMDDIINEVAIKLKLTRSEGELWLNDKASRVALPAKIIERATPITKWSNIDAKLVDRKDLISMKVSAFFSRREMTLKDLEDLKILNPSHDEILEAIEFVKTHNAPPEGAGQKIRDEFKESEDDIKKLFLK